jgi:protein-disulfide isomerase
MKARPSIFIALLGLSAASCRNSDRGERPGGPTKNEPVADEPAVTDIPGLDLGELEPTVRNDALRVLNDTYCYCGCPRTVASCLANRSDCSCTNCSERMARFIMNEYKGGASTEDVEAQLLGGFSEGFNGPQRTFDGKDQAAKGPEGAPYVIVEFADFKCPHCAGAFEILNDLVGRRGDVRIEYFYFPLSGNGEASVRAAEAAEEARRQGKFWEMAKELFEGQFDLSEANVGEHAKKVGLDMDAFNKAMSNRAHRDKVFANKKLGESVGVESTPALFLNGRSFGLARTIENLEMRIEMEAERGTCN